MLLLWAKHWYCEGWKREKTWALTSHCCFLVAKSCPTLLWPHRPDSSVHGISQAIIRKWVAISYSRGSSQGLNPCLLHWQVNENPFLKTSIPRIDPFPPPYPDFTTLVPFNLSTCLPVSITLSQISALSRAEILFGISVFAIASNM